MALIRCIECGKSISDKATACPNCGYPMNEPGSGGVGTIEFKKLNKEQLWLKAYNLHYKGRNSDIPMAVEMYRYIVDNFDGTNECDYANAQLDILSKKFSLEAGRTEVLDSSDTSAGVSNSLNQSNHYGNMSSVTDFDKFTKEQLWFKAYTLHYTGRECDLQTIVDIYKYILDKFKGTDEYNGAKRQLDNLMSRYTDQRSGAVTIRSPKHEITTTMSELHEYERYRISVAGKYQDMISSYVNADKACTRSDITDNLNSIPTYGGLAALSFVIGFGILGGMVVGSHSRTKKMIAQGNYEEALKASSNTFTGAMIVIFGVPAVIVIMIFAMMHGN